MIRTESPWVTLSNSCNSNGGLGNGGWGRAQVDDSIHFSDLKQAHK